MEGGREGGDIQKATRRIGLFFLSLYTHVHKCAHEGHNMRIIFICMCYNMYTFKNYIVLLKIVVKIHTSHKTGVQTHTHTLHSQQWGPQWEQSVFWLSKHWATAAVKPRAATQEGSPDHIINHTAYMGHVLCTRTHTVCVCACVCVFRGLYVPPLIWILHVIT